MTDFEKLFQDNRAFIFKFLLKLCRNASLAEELTGETFFRAYMNYAGLRNKDKASVWLCQIARNTYFAWYNQQMKAEICEPQPMPDQSSGPEEMLLQKELSDKAFSCLQELEEPYREVFLLSVFGEMSFKQISQSFQKSESWARVTFYRAKQKLLEKMRY